MVCSLRGCVHRSRAGPQASDRKQERGDRGLPLRVEAARAWLRVAMLTAATMSPSALAELGAGPGAVREDSAREASAREESAPETVERLERELSAVKQRLERLEALLRERGFEREVAASRDAATPPGEPTAGSVTEQALIEQPGEAPTVFADASPGAERAEEGERAAAEQDPRIHIGGAVRFNAFFNDDSDISASRFGESGLDLFRLSADGTLDDILVSAEYRFYPFMDTIHHGWLGYAFDDDSQVQLGIHQVPFGILPFASHNFWFGVPYYVGLADDYDLGVKYVRDDGPWQTHLGFYKNAELADPADLGRYGFDVVRDGDQRNEESNRVNVRLAYTLGAGSSCQHELGVSGQWGQIYNATTDENGDQWATAAHLDSHCGRWNLQLQAARYEFDTKTPPGVRDDVVRLGAFETSFDIAAEATMLVANLAYNFDVPWSFLDSVTCYNDYSRLIKDEDAFEPSQLNTTGCALSKGPVFAYFDVIQASNMVFFGDGSLAGGDDDEWRTRYNINIGYYW